MIARHATRLGPAFVGATFAVLLVMIGTGLVSAHPGGPEEVLVVGDHADPGQTFRVLGAFIEPDVDVAVSVVSGSQRFDLGTVRVDAEGRFDVSLTLPAEVPLGYAELHLAQPTEGDTTTVFLVGPRDGSSTPAPTATSLSGLGSQAGALLLFVGTLIGIAVVGIILIRGSTGRASR